MKPNTGWDTSGILPGALFIGFEGGFQTMLWLAILSYPAKSKGELPG